MALRYDDISQVPPALREQLIRQGIVPGKGKALQSEAAQRQGEAGRSGAMRGEGEAEERRSAARRSAAEQRIGVAGLSVAEAKQCNGDARRGEAGRCNGEAGRCDALARHGDARQSLGGKYGNRKATVDGITFDSRKEASRFLALRALEDMGMIWDLRLQVDFTLQEAYTTSDGERVRATRYKADFTYYMLEDGKQVYVVEDVKSSATRTRVYLDKKKRMLDKYGIRVREV